MCSRKKIIRNTIVLFQKMKNLVSLGPTAFVNQDNCKRGLKVNLKNPLITTQILLLILLTKSDSAQRLQEWTKRGLRNTETDHVRRRLCSKSAFHACHLLSSAYSGKEPRDKQGLSLSGIRCSQMLSSFNAMRSPSSCRNSH